ncbi:TonB-dependent receptor domain-containing protein [Edaphobacter aggregans]|uniref:TonB-dependent receptor domain-containing protein n=1 Tax=Edaphobacter aggregans TaxID=570835 RepID=UPI00316AC891
MPYTVTLQRVPNLGFADLSGAAGFGQYRDYNYNHNVFDNLSYIVGKHSLKFGFTYNHYLKSENAGGDNVGNYNFDSTNNVGLDALSLQSQDWANCLLGYASDSFSQAPIDVTANTTQNLWEFYGQDEWRATPRVTLSFGLRYSYFQTPFDGANKLTSFDPSVYDASKAPKIDPKTGLMVPNTGTANNGIIVGGVNSPYGRYITKQNKANFAPRFGVAYDVFGDGTTALRAGAGLFYDSVAAGLAEDNTFNNPPFISSANFGSVTNISNTGSLTALTNNLPPSLWTTAPNWKTPYAAEWNVDLQHQFKQAHNLILDIGYVGNKGTHLVGVQDINQVKPGVAAASGLYTNPYAGGTAAGAKLNAVRPYLGYGSIGQIAPQFDSNYNSLQLSVEQPLTANLTANAAYTYSHGLTDNQSDRSSGLQNTYCRLCEYGSSSIDRRHVFTGNFIYQLPFYRDQVGAIGHLLGGWQTSGIITVNSGLPLTVLAGRTGTFGDPAASGLNVVGAPNNGSPSTPRPNQIANPNNGPKTWSKFFNTAAFSAPTGPQMYGGTERRGAVLGPGLWRYDMAVSKDTRIFERLSMQFRVEAFNLFNHTNFSTLNTTLTSSLYGRVTGTRDPRILQLSTKFQPTSNGGLRRSIHRTDKNS